MDEKKREESWREMRLQTSGDGNYDEILQGRRRTALQSLAARYRWFSNMALVMLIWCPLTMFNEIFGDTMEKRVIISVSYGIFMLISSSMDRWLYHGIRRIDCAEMTVGEVSRLAVFYRKRHLQFMMILMPLALLWIGMLLYFNFNDIYFVAGVATGAVVGLALGYRQYLKFMDSYRNLLD